MMSLSTELQALEQLFQLMDKYKISEVCCDYINVKKDRFQEAPPTPEQLLQQHTATKVEEIKAKAHAKVEEIDAWLNKKDV